MSRRGEVNDTARLHGAIQGGVSNLCRFTLEPQDNPRMVHGTSLNIHCKEQWPPCSAAFAVSSAFAVFSGLKV